MEEGERDGRVREPKMPVEFQAKLAAKNEQLEEMDIVALNDEEFYAARLYTGPMFMKYNAVLRGTPEASLDWLKEVMDQVIIPPIPRATPNAHAQCPMHAQCQMH